MAIRLLAGLGNPGPKHARTRHNAGFWFADRVAARWGGTFRPERNFSGETAECQVDGHRLRLLKPMTYMNLSGQAVAAMAGFYKIDTPEILVVHDDIDLPCGTVRLKVGGGHGGHNGLRDIIPALGNDASFARIRLGIGHPGHADEVSGHVLRPATAEDQTLIESAMERALDELPRILAGEFHAAMNVLNRREREAKEAAPDEC